VTAKLLEYPVGDLRLAGAAWPWPVTLLPLVLVAASLAVIAVLTRTLRNRRPS
jgi:hypothetical protein